MTKLTDTEADSWAEQATSEPTPAGSPAGLRPERVFACFFLAYLLTWGGHYTTGDGATKIAWARAMLDRGSADIDPGPAVRYSKYGIGHSLVALAPLAASRIVEHLGGPRVEAALYTLLFVANGAAFLALVARLLSPYYPFDSLRRLLLLLGFGTIWWPYTRLDFSEPLLATVLLGAVVLVRENRPKWGMLLASAAGLIKPEAFLLAAVVSGWYAWISPRRLRAVGWATAMMLPALLLHGLTTWLRADSNTGTYSGEAFSTPLLVGLHGLLLSGGKSIFIFSPPLILGLYGLRTFASRPRLRQDALLFAALFVTQVLLYAGWWDWSGDDSWGPRFLVPGAMLLTIPAIAVVDRRRLVYPVAIVGITVQLLAVVVSPLDFVLLARGSHLERVRLFDGSTTRIDFEDIRFNPRYSQLAGQWILARYAVGLPPRWTRDAESHSGRSLHASLPPDEWARAARIDILWIRLLCDQRTQ